MHLTLRQPNYVLLGSIALGVCADYFFNGRSLGISVPLFLGLCLALLLGLSYREGRRPAPANLWLGGLALCFGVGIMVRATPLLVFLDALAVLGCMLLLVAHYQSSAIVRLPLLRVVGETVRALITTTVDPLPLMAQEARKLPAAPTQRLMPLARGLLLALPVVSCFGLLLMSADSVFASYVREVMDLRLSWTTDLMRWLRHGIFTLAATYLCAGAMIAALGSERSTPAQHLTPGDLPSEIPAEGDTQRLDKARRRFLGFTEALTVLVAVDLLFGSFMLIQAAYLFGGLNTLDRTGMTYAEYARRGFFELLIVTCLALGLVGTLAYLTQRVQQWKQRAFNGTSAVLILLMLGMLTSAFQRLLIYEEVYGYTRLRLYTHSFMIWLAVVLPIFLIALHLNRFRVFLLGTIATATLYLGLLNVVNTDALIVQQNIARYQHSSEDSDPYNDKLDTSYLTTLSFDATPALVTSLHAVQGEKQSELNAHLIAQYQALDALERTQSWPSWHLGRAQALRYLRQRYGPTPPTAQRPDDSINDDGSATTSYGERIR